MVIVCIFSGGYVFVGYIISKGVGFEDVWLVCFNVDGEFE